MTVLDFICTYQHDYWRTYRDTTVAIFNRNFTSDLLYVGCIGDFAEEYVTSRSNKYWFELKDCQINRWTTDIFISNEEWHWQGKVDFVIAVED